MADSQNFFVKLYHGDVSLVVTFWVFYVIVSSVLHIVLPPIFAFIVAIYFSLATWNSAGKYQGTKIFATLARILVVLGLLGMLMSIFIAPAPPV